ncbi:MAG: chemotaxis protein CheW [Gemmatimonadota bacterium]
MPDNAREPLVLCTVGRLDFAVPARLVLEVQDSPRLTRIPGVDPAVLGLAQVRGALAVVVDVGRLLGLEARSGAKRTELVVLGLPAGRVALAVDQASDVLVLAADQFSDPAPGRMRPAIVGEGSCEGRTFMVLDVPALLSPLLAAETGGRQASAWGET